MRVSCCDLLYIVSILARPGGRALPEQRIISDADRMFQSSPAPEDGRYPIVLNGATYYIRFNPRPPRRTGATANLRRNSTGKSSFQSSPAPEDGRYQWRSHREPDGESFNPRPPRRTGATGRASFCATLADVSILARPGGRALRSGSPLCGTIWSFQSSPAPEDGRYGMRCPLLHEFQRFQSSPAPEDGRYRPGKVLKPDRKSFNPRPPRRTGATWVMNWLNRAFCVSILARPGGRALPFRSSNLAAYDDCFNPRPPRRTGATELRHDLIHTAQMFQSSPAPEDGRYDIRAISFCSIEQFQSSPAPEDGRYPRRNPRHHLHFCFNPRPPRRTGATCADSTCPTPA